MNSNYNYSDFAGIRLTANNELDHNVSHASSQQKLEKAFTHSYETPSEKQIEEMLLSHNKFYVYCE
jgi:hypothetical protein